MLAKTVEKNGRDWDRRLPYVLFAYRTAVQASTCESPFFLMYGCDARLPTATDITTTTECDLVDLSDFAESRAKKKAHSPNSQKAVESEESEVETPAPEQVPQKDSKEGVWSGCLHSHKRVNVSEDASA